MPVLQKSIGALQTLSSQWYQCKSRSITEGEEERRVLQALEFTLFQYYERRRERERERERERDGEREREHGEREREREREKEKRM